MEVIDIGVYRTENLESETNAWVRKTTERSRLGQSGGTPITVDYAVKQVPSPEDTG